MQLVASATVTEHAGMVSIGARRRLEMKNSQAVARAAVRQLNRRPQCEGECRLSTQEWVSKFEEVTEWIHRGG